MYGITVDIQVLRVGNTCFVFTYQMENSGVVNMLKNQKTEGKRFHSLVTHLSVLTSVLPDLHIFINPLTVPVADLRLKYTIKM